MSPAFSVRPWAIVALVAIGVNLPSLHPGFIHDDHRIIEQNELIRSLDNLPRILRQGYWSVDARSVPILYRPLTIISFALNYSVGGLHPYGYRVLNLLLHAVASLLVFAIARRMLGGIGAGAPPVASLFAAALFAAHPVHTEVLGEVVGRAELLAAVGTLGSVLAFLRARDFQEAGRGRAAAGFFALSLLLVAAGLLSKENAVVAPFLTLMAERLIARRRPEWRYHLAAGLVLALCLGARALALGSLNPPGSIHFLDNPIAHLPFLQGRLTALKVIARYALLLIAPLHLCIDYSYDAIHAARDLVDPGALMGLTILLAVTLVTVVAWRGSRAVAFSLAFIGVALLPVANLILPIGTIMAERLLYLPSVGLCLLAGVTVGWFLDHESGAAGIVARAAALLLLAAFAARSTVRFRDWRDDYAIFKAALAVEPDSVRSLYNYGAACEDRGKDGEAMSAYLKAVALWPDFADAQYNLAGVYARGRQWEEAVRRYREAVRVQPANVKYLANLGRSLNGLGRHSEARDVLGQAVAIDPRSAEAQTDLGAAALALDDVPGALRAYAEAARIDPSSADYQRNLALAQERSGDTASAQESFRRGLDLRPGDPDLLVGLGLARLEGGDPSGALLDLEAAARARPAHPIYRYQVGRALERLGRLQEAASRYRESARLAPASPVPLKALGLLLDRMGDRAGALEALEHAASLDSEGKIMDAESRRVLERLRQSSRTRAVPSRKATGS